MENDKKEIQRKLNLAKESLSEITAGLERLEKLAAPLNERIAKAKDKQEYFRGRIEKLTKMLSGM